MFQDLFVILLIPLFAGLGAIVILRAVWKTKRRRRHIPSFTSRERRALSR